MDAGGRRQLERRPGDEEQGRRVYRFRANSPLPDLKQRHLLSSVKQVFLLNADAGYSLLQGSISLGEEGGPCRPGQAVPPRSGRAAPLSLLHVVDDRQDAHLLLGRVHILILLLGHSRAQAIQPPTVLGIINTVLKKQLFHPEECHSRQQ